MRSLSSQDFAFFEGAIQNDIPGAISAGANFLVALGLVSYTEFLGAIINGQLGVSNKSQENFNTGFYAMGVSYKIFDQQVKDRFEKSFYSVFRCGLVHEYFAKQPFVVAEKNLGELGVGWMDDRIAMATQNYYDHLLPVLARVRNEFYS